MAAVLILLIPSEKISLKKIIFSSTFILLSILFSGYFDWYIFPIALIFCLFFSVDIFSFISKKYIVICCEVLFVFLSIYFTFTFISKLITDSAFNYTDTYYVIGIASSRNMIFEYYSVLLVLLLFFSKHKFKLFAFHVIALLLSALFLSKSALFVIVLSLIYLIWKNKKQLLFKQLFNFIVIPISFLFLLFNIYNLYVFSSSEIKYDQMIKNRTAHLKEFDLIYQYLNRFSSFNLRSEIWRNSEKIYSSRGKGIGFWKIKYNCVNKPVNDLIVRRAHNEFIRYSIEFGLLFCIPFCFFIYYIKFLFPVLPLFLFSYPTERAEFLLLFLLIPSFLNKSSFNYNKKLQNLIVKGLKIGLIILVLLWARVNFLQYDLLIYYGNYSTLNPVDKFILDFTERDFLLNRTELLKIKDMKLTKKEKKKLVNELKISKDCELQRLYENNKKSFKKIKSNTKILK